jgi:hypothetical protein
LGEEFIKKYKQIRTSKDQSFEDRLKFDIEKRRNKHDIYEIIKKAHEKRLPSKALNRTFENLCNDAQKRKGLQKRMQIQKDKEELRNEKKLTIKEFKQIYARFTKASKKKEAELARKREQKQVEENSKLIRTQHSHISSLEVTARMEDDIRKRQQRDKAILRDKKLKETQEVALYIYNS